MSRSARAVIASVRPLFLGLGILMLGRGLLGTAVGIRAELEQFPTAVAGVVMSCFYLGFLIGCWIAPRMVQISGHVKMFAGFAMLGAVAAIGYPLMPDPAVWSIIRVVTGSHYGRSLSGLRKLASGGSPKTRGRLLAVYLLVVNAGYGVGQSLLSRLTGPADSLFNRGVLDDSLRFTTAFHPAHHPGQIQPSASPFSGVSPYHARDGWPPI